MARVQSTKKNAAIPQKTKAGKHGSESKTKVAFAGAGKAEPTPASPSKSKSKSKGKGKGKESVGLKDAVLALGGDEDDLELLKDVDSDLEGAGPSSSKGNDVRIY